MRKLRPAIAALVAAVCLYAPSAAAEPASQTDSVPPSAATPTQTEESGAPTGKVEESADAVTLDETLTYGNDEYTVDVTVRGTAAMTDAEAPAADVVVDSASSDLAMSVDVLDESQPEWQAVEDYAESKEESGDVLDVTALDFGFTYQGRTLDMSDCELTAAVAPSDALVAAGAAPKAAAEAETGVEVTALNGATEELGTVMVPQNEDETKTLDVTLDSTAPMLGLTANSALNPHFTVQYYANLEVTDRDSEGYLQITREENSLPMAVIRRPPVCILWMPATASVRFAHTCSSPSCIPPTSTTTTRHRACRT